MASAAWFAGRLRELREAAGWTQEQLAERAGVMREAVARWEAGRREPGWSNVLALAEALGVDCTAFTQAPAERPSAGPGRPRKEPAGVPTPKRPRGRPRKEQGEQLHATESTPLEPGPGPPPTKKGRAGKLPERQEKPKARNTRRPRG